MNYIEEIRNFVPGCEQEEKDRALMLAAWETYGDAILERSCELFHLTASSMVFNRERTKVLMAYHNIFQSWAWTGGHADGETDLLAVAMREAKEETGVTEIRALSELPFSIEILTVDGHVKRGSYVPSHLHLNVTYLLEADEDEVLRVKPDENSGVKWFPLEEALAASTEAWMVERVYRKLNEKLAQIR